MEGLNGPVLGVFLVLLGALSYGVMTRQVIRTCGLSVFAYLVVSESER